MSIIHNKFMAEHDEPFVVFLIGMRIHKLLSFRKWLPVAKAMRPMIEELVQNKELGMLGFEIFRSRRDTVFIQYWKNQEVLMKYAHGSTHMRAWREYYQKSHDSGAVGIWHETYCVEPGKYETAYANMPPFGLSKATKTASATGPYETAAERLKRGTTT